MIHDFHLADIGEGLDEAEIIEWKVAIGDTVQRDQPIVEVMTDKSNAELPAPVSGVVVALGGEIGDLLEVGAMVARIDEGDPEQHGSTSPAHADRAPSTFQDASRSIERDGASTDPLSGAAETPTPNAPSRRPKASPSTRAEAARRGIDLRTISGTGPGGRILLADLDGTGEPSPAEAPAHPVSTEAPLAIPPRSESARPGASLAPETSGPETTASETTAPETTASEITAPEITASEITAPETTESETAAPETTARSRSGVSTGSGPNTATETTESVEPLRGMRRAIALNMARSWSEIPHIHLHQQIDAEPLLELRRQLRASDRTEFAALTPLTFFVAAVTRAMAEHPEANATLDLEAGLVTRHGEVNVGVAVAADQGLVVPVVRQADHRSFADLAIEVTRLVTSARLGDLEPAAYRGGTVTITNFGSLGGEQALPLIRPPESAIFGFGSIAQRPFVIEDRVVARHTMYIVLGADHRLLDGDVTTAMLTRVADLLTAPIDLVLDR